MIGFVESHNRRKPNPPESNFNSSRLFYLGLMFMLGFTFILVPFGAYYPISISIWALLVFFLPLLFVGISFISKYGYVILIAVFLSLIDGGISILYLGDYLGFITQITAVSNMEPEQAVISNRYKYIYLKNFKIREELGGSFQAPITIRARGNTKIYGPVLQFRYAPIFSVANLEKELSLYALCYANKNEKCEFNLNISGGNVLREIIWDSQKINVTGSPPKEGAIFIIWKGNGIREFSSKGLASLGAISLSILLWTFCCFRRKK